MQKSIRWLTTVFGPLPLITILLNENIKKLFEQEGWNKWLADSWHPALKTVVALLLNPVTAYVGCFISGIAATLWIVRLKTGSGSTNPKLPLSRTLYVGEILVSVDNIAQERHSEISIRLFNGSEASTRVVAVSGQVTFSSRAGSGKLPTPTIRAPAPDGLPFKEWFVVLDQRTPSSEAKLLTDTLENGGTIQFDLRGLKIDVSNGLDRTSLSLAGVTATRTRISYGRIVYAEAHVKLGSTITI